MNLRPSPAALAEVLDTSRAVRTHVDAWRGGVLLGADIPLLAGTLTETGDQRIPEAVSLTVPAVDWETSRRWTPAGDPLAPLAANGQRLRLTYVVERLNGSTLSVPLGWFPIQAWDSDGETVGVEAVGLGRVLDEARLLAPTSPPAAATFRTEIRRLVEGLMPLHIDPALVDRAVPRSMTWEDDRLGALYELADAWPAVMSVSEAGVLTYSLPPAAAAPAEISYTETGGTVLSAKDSGSRDGIANVVVARGENTGDPARPPVTAVAQDSDPTSPTYSGGPYGRVVEFFTSPLMGTTAQCFAAATTVLERRLATARAVPLETLPDPRVRPGVRAEFTRTDGTVMSGRLTTTVLPLTAAGGQSTVHLAEIL